MIKRQNMLAALVLVLAHFCAAQPQTAKLDIRAALADNDLNVKPVPRLQLNLQPATGGDPLKATTSFDGLTELNLLPGQYRVTTVQPVAFQGKKYSWELNLTIKPGGNSLELGADNARVSESASSPGRT